LNRIKSLEVETKKEYSSNGAVHFNPLPLTVMKKTLPNYTIKNIKFWARDAIMSLNE